GVLERHPALRIVHLESGAGWVAFWLYRLQAGNQGGSRGIPIPGLKMDPIDYWQRQCYISADPDDPGIKQVVDAIGDDNIILATTGGSGDHPNGQPGKDRYRRSGSVRWTARRGRYRRQR